MVRPPYAMSVARKAGMLLIRGALATQVWILSTNEGTPCGHQDSVGNGIRGTGEEYKTAWASRRCSAQTDPIRVSRWPSRVGGRSVGQRSPAVARQRSG